MVSNSSKRPRTDENTPPQGASFINLSGPPTKRQYRRQKKELTDEDRAEAKAAYERGKAEREAAAAELAEATAKAVEEAAKEVAAQAKLELVASMNRSFKAVKQAGFKKFWLFLDAIMKSDDQFIKSRMAKLCSQHGAELHSHIYNHQPLMSEQWISTQIRGILDLEGGNFGGNENLLILSLQDVLSNFRCKH